MFLEKLDAERPSAPKFEVVAGLAKENGTRTHMVSIDKMQAMAKCMIT